MMLQTHSRAPPTPPQASFAARQQLNLRDVVSFWRRYVLLLGSCVVASMLLGWVYVLVTPPNFIAVSQVVIQSRRTPWIGTGSTASFVQQNLDSGEIESQIQIIRSEQISKQVVQGLHLENDPELVGPNSSLLSMLRRLVVDDAGPSELVDPVMASIRALSNRLQVRRVGQSHVLEISYWSGDRDKAARICNSITAAYIGDLLKAKIDAAQSGSEILEHRISTLREQWAAADRIVRSGVFGAETFPTAEARVITVATPPASRSWPRTSLILAFSALLGLFLALLGAAIHRSLDNSIRTRRQVDQSLGLEPLGVLPRLRTLTGRGLAREVVRHPSSAFSKAVRQIKTSLQLRQLGSPLVCIGVTSTAGAEGSPALAANLAHALAGAGARTLLIDADAHEVGLTRMMLPKASAGLLDVLEGDVLLDEALVQGEAGSPDFLPIVARGRHTRAADLLASDRMNALLTACRQRYATVLVALPALEDAPDARAVAPLLDGVVLATAYGRLSADRIATSLRGLEQSDVEVLGAVITRSPHDLTS